jgi:DNA-directed RNA polymerase specialized sigma subunit
VIDGIHRIEACRRLEIDSIDVATENIPDNELRVYALKYNMGHGVPPNKEERDKLICDLYFKDGKTQVQIGKLVKLDDSQISRIINNLSTQYTYKKEEADKRREISEKDHPAPFTLSSLNKK